MSPHFYSPVTDHHDNENESQAHLLRLLNVVFLGVVLCLSWNVFAVATAWITSLVATKVFVLAVMYLVLWVSVAHVSWYRLLNRALRSEDGKDYDWAFVFYMLYFGFWSFTVLTVPIIYEGRSIVGMIPSLIILGENTWVGILYLIGCFSFLVEWGLSTYVCHKVWLHYRHIMMGLEDNKDMETAMRDRSRRIVWFIVLPFTGFCLCFVVLMTVRTY